MILFHRIDGNENSIFYSHLYLCALLVCISNFIVLPYLLFGCCVFSQILFSQDRRFLPSNKKEWLIVLETISISSTMMVASLAVRLRFPLLLSTRHFLIPCHPFTAEINCYVPDRLNVTFRTRGAQALRRQITSKSQRWGLPYAHSRTDAPSSALIICRQPSFNYL